MKLRLSSLKDLHLHAVDGTIGTVKDTLLDDAFWTLRYLEVHTGSWLFGRRVLISPIHLGALHLDRDAIDVQLSKEDIENAPGLDSDQPVSRQYETSYAQHFGSGYYWLGGHVWGASLVPSALLTPVADAPAPDAIDTSDDAHLRLTSEVTGYDVHDRDGEPLGDVRDFVIDSDSWQLSHLVLDTGKWLRHHEVLVPTSIVQSITWADRRVDLSVAKALVNETPETAIPPDAAAEERLSEHYAGG